MKIGNIPEFCRLHPGLLLSCLSLSLMSAAGSGSVKLVALTALAICIYLMFSREIRTELPVILGIFIFCICCWISSFRRFGGLSFGYAANFPFYILFYLLISGLNSEERALMRRFCVFLAEIIALVGIFRYLYRSYMLDPVRLGFILGNPNMLGIFLVMALLLLREFEDAGDMGLIIKLKPLIVCALVLSLSMGSYLALALGLLFILISESRGNKFKAALSRLLIMLAELIIYAVPAVLMIIFANTGLPFLTVPCAVLEIFLCSLTKALKNFLSSGHRALLLVLLLGLPAAGFLIILRPTASETFAERISMIKNGWNYFLQNPLGGVGIYNWRELNRSDWDIDYNTWHIHNAAVHVAAEMGIFALLALLIWAVGLCRDRENRKAFPIILAYYFHCLMDVSFFHMGPGSLFMASVCRAEGKFRIPAPALKIISLLLAVFYIHAFIIRI